MNGQQKSTDGLAILLQKRAERLKKSILQEAIQGRLVPQDPNDEPAAVLLDNIRKEKKRQVKEGKLKKKDLEETPISEDEIPFDIPESWEWCRHNELFDISGGSQPPKSDFSTEEKNGYIRLYQIRDYGDKPSPVFIPLLKASKITQKGDILLARYGGSLGKVFIAEDGAYNVAMAKVEYSFCKSSICHKYLYYYYHGSLYQDLVKGNNRSAQGGFNKEDLGSLLFPLPPLAEQRRIVAKIEELLPKVEEYGKAQEALDKLNSELPERLKKSILQEAITGHLVPQDPNDEPASVLLDKIRKEKARLVKEGKLKKKDLEETPISEDEKPFEIPESWEWVRLGDITYNHGQKTPIDIFSYIDIGSIDNKRQQLNDNENILSAKEAPSRARKIVRSGDILYATVRPYLHNMCIVDRMFSKEPIASTGFAVLSCIQGVCNKYLFYYLLSPVFDAYANDGENAKGMAYPAINDKKLYNGVVPLPPLSEQHRIVAKIEELMKEIDKLKA